MELMDEIQKKVRQNYTPLTLYNTMHISHMGYRGANQGIAVAGEWLHLLRGKRGGVHNPWSDAPITLIELGCGNGKLCEFLKKQSMDVTGTDIFDNDAVYNRSLYKFVQHDLTQVPYPFKDNEFDYALSFDVLEHLEEKYIAPALKEMARIGRNLIIKVSCSGERPLHLTIKSPGWWFDQFIENCPDFSWQLVRNYERIVKKDGPVARSQDTFSDVRPVPDGYLQTYAPLFFGRRGTINES